MYLILQTSTVQYFQPEEFYQDASGLYYDNPERVATHMSEILPDYIPKGLTVDATKVPVSKVRCLVEECVLHPVVERGHERLYTFQKPPNSTVTVAFAIADFPGWTVFADTQKISHHQSESGTIVVELPAGTQRVGVQFQGTTVRDLSDILSLLSVVTVGALYMFQHKASFLRKDVV